MFGGIAAALLVAYLVPPDALLPLPFWPRLIVAVVLAFLPIFLANVALSGSRRPSRPRPRSG